MSKYPISTTILIVFIILKLVGVIDWSWLWVLSPIWISIGLDSLLLTMILLFKMCFRR